MTEDKGDTTNLPANLSLDEVLDIWNPTGNALDRLAVSYEKYEAANKAGHGPAYFLDLIIKRTLKGLGHPQASDDIFVAQARSEIITRLFDNARDRYVKAVSNGAIDHDTEYNKASLGLKNIFYALQRAASIVDPERVVRIVAAPSELLDEIRKYAQEHGSAAPTAGSTR